MTDPVIISRFKWKTSHFVGNRNRKLQFLIYSHRYYYYCNAVISTLIISMHFDWYEYEMRIRKKNEKKKIKIKIAHEDKWMSEVVVRFGVWICVCDVCCTYEFVSNLHHQQRQWWPRSIASSHIQAQSYLFTLGTHVGGHHTSSNTHTAESI